MQTSKLEEELNLFGYLLHMKEISLLHKKGDLNWFQLMFSFKRILLPQKMNKNTKITKKLWNKLWMSLSILYLVIQVYHRKLPCTASNSIIFSLKGIKDFYALSQSAHFILEYLHTFNSSNLTIHQINTPIIYIYIYLYIFIYIYIYIYIYVCMYIYKISNNIKNELPPSRNNKTKFTRYYIITWYIS